MPPRLVALAALAALVFRGSIAFADDEALARGRALLDREREVREELLGEEYFQVMLHGQAVGYYRTITRPDEERGRAVYQIQGWSLFEQGEARERMEYLYVAYPDLTPVHYQRNRRVDGDEGEVTSAYLLRLDGTRFRIRRGEEEPIEVEFRDGLVGFDLVTHLVRLVALDATGPIALEMLDEGGEIRQVTIEVGEAGTVEVDGEPVAARKVVHAGLQTASGAPFAFDVWRAVDDGRIVGMIARIGSVETLHFVPMTRAAFRRRYGTPGDAAIDFLRAIEARDRARLAEAIDFRESFLLTLSKNAIHKNMTGREILALWAKIGDDYRATLLESLARERLPLEAVPAASDDDLGRRIRAVESDSGRRAVVLFRADGGSIYLYLHRGEDGWRVTYVGEEE